MPNTMTWKGAWAGDGSDLSLFPYIKDDTVKHDGIVYVSVSGNVPIGSPSPNLDMSNWNVVVTDGVSGTSGQTGSSGTSGSSGETGASGSSGTSGQTGSSGTSGTSGNGTSGTSGNGTSGTSGANGNEYGFYYRLTNATTEADPSSGRLRFNNLVQPDSTFIYIDRYSVDLNNDLQEFFTGLSNYGNPDFRGLLTITSAIDGTFFQIYNFSSVQDMSGWFKIGVSVAYSQGSFVLPTQEYVYIRFTPASSGTSGTSGSAGTSGTRGSSGTSGTAGTAGSSGSSGSAGTSGTAGTSSNTKTTGNWTLSTGANTVSFTVTAGESYVMWVNGNIPNGIINWNATVTLSNSNVPVIGVQYGWYYLAGNALVLTSIPSQIVGTAGSISTSAPAGSNTNTFTFGITNNSGASQIVYYGYTQI